MVEEAEYLCLEDDCWRHVLKFLKEDDEFDEKSFLKSMSLVSKAFLSIANRLRLSLTIYDPTAPFLPSLLHRFTNLTSLDLTHFHGDLNAILHQISLFPLKLTSLNLSHKPIIPANALRAFSRSITTLTSLNCSNVPSFNSTHLFLIADCFPSLQHLDLNLSHVNIYSYNTTNFLHGIEALSLSLSKLRSINLSMHNYIDDKSIFHLFNNCKLLEEVILDDCFLLTKQGVASALGVAKQTTLRYLSLPIYLTAQVIHSLLTFKALTNLHFTFSTLSDQLLTSIAIQALPLTTISIRSCEGYTYAGLFTLLSNSPSLQHFDLHLVPFLDDHHLLQLSSYLAGLLSISLSRCFSVTDSSLFALVRKCPSLTHITMKGITYNRTQNYDYLMDFGVCPQLKSLNMSSNPWLTDQRITIFVSLFPNLHLLDLNACPNISQQGVLQVLNRCRNITHLNLSRCYLTSSGEDLVFQIFKEGFKIRNLNLSLPNLSSGVNLLGMNFQVPKLKMLNLSFSNVDDQALYSISKSCCGLLQLVINDCLGCTEKGLKHVLQNCTQLREINLKNCSNVHANVAQSLLFSTPSLRKITVLPDIHFTVCQRILLLQRGCIVC